MQTGERPVYICVNSPYVDESTGVRAYGVDCRGGIVGGKNGEAWQ